MAGTFTAQVNNWVAATQERYEAVVKQSAQEVISEMQTPVAKGGNLPVDTGWLRASMRTGLNDIAVRADMERPLIKGRKPGDPPIFDTDDAAPAQVISGMAMGDTIYATYGANYAPFQEAKRGFVRLAAQRWQQIVDRVAIQTRNREEGR